jgi:hypothetical protein
MDDQTNDRYSRAPEFEDLVKLCKSLNEQQVKYVLIGGFAVILHGAGRTTKDIDLLLETSEENIKKLKKAMSFLPDDAISQIEDDEMSKYQVVRIADEFVVDLMAKACGIDYDMATQGIEWKNVDGVMIPIANKEWLIRMKDTIRISDHMDVEFLKKQIEDEKIKLENKK